MPRVMQPCRPPSHPHSELLHSGRQLPWREDLLRERRRKREKPSYLPGEGNAVEQSWSSTSSLELSIAREVELAVKVEVLGLGYTLWMRVAAFSSQYP